MHPMPPKAAWIKSSANYKMPGLTLVRADGASGQPGQGTRRWGKPWVRRGRVRSA
ncbi:MAG: hypothetical protein MZW92_01055 [Comamonadaceae bacterium]|nr:hypothetical protein [Comamonadaceae bacterium]